MIIFSLDIIDKASKVYIIETDENWIEALIEGNEWDALQGAKEIVKKSSNLKCAICCYHNDFDEILINDLFQLS